MDESTAPAADAHDRSSSEKQSKDGMRESVEAEIREMEKYRWILGVNLKHDPLKDRSLNDIYCEWIQKYAADFRRQWEKKREDKERSQER